MIRTSEDVKKNIKIQVSVHEKVRVQAALNKTTIEKWVEDALIRKLESSSNPADQAAGLRKIVNE